MSVWARWKRAGIIAGETNTNANATTTTNNNNKGTNAKNKDIRNQPM